MYQLINKAKGNKQDGFTIIELMVALTVLTLLALFAGRTYLNYIAAARDLKAANLVYEEARFLMERMVREVRQNGIDFEEYFSRNVLENANYGQAYCAYDLIFYDAGFDGDIFTTSDNESLGMRNEDLGYVAPLATPLQDELYLVNIAGNERTYLKRIERDVDGNLIGKVATIKLIGKDFGSDNVNSADPFNNGDAPDLTCEPDARENDGLIDTWHCDPDFPCTTDTPVNVGLNCDGYLHTVDDDGFVDISPNAINVVDLKFIITPADDPWKAYNVNEVQIQPHVTIQFTAQANPDIVATSDPTRIPSVTLTSTITTRNYDEIKSSCGRT